MRRSVCLLAWLMLLLAAVPGMTWAQERTITGTVTSAEDGLPLPGASVVVPGTSIGTATTTDGHYELDVPADAEQLRFSFIGFIPKEIPINGRTTIEVELQPDLQSLEEVVVVGYGTQIQRELTGSISQVSSEEIQNVPVNSLEEAVQGKAAGVFITKGSGKLGQGIQVRVRGAASVSADNEPLYVVDGIPITTQNLSGNSAATNPLAQLSIQDIESIEILKDAAATAIYGARASNGVVLITTKSGTESGDTQFTVNLQRNWSAPTNQVDMLNAQEYVNFFTEAARNRGEHAYATNPGDWVSEQQAINYWVDTAEGVFDFYARGTDWTQTDVNADWQDQAFREDAGGFKIDVSARGGNEDTQFYLSGTFDTQNGILIRDNYDRITGRLNLDHQVDTWFRVGGKVSLARVLHTRVPYDNAFSTPIQLIAQLPISPIYQPQSVDTTDAGYYQRYVPSDELNRDTYYFNNLLYKDNVRYRTTIFRTVSSAFAELDLLPGLTFRSQFGIDLLDQNEDEYYNSEVYQNTGALKGLGINAWDRVVNYNVDGYFTYTTSFADIHNLEVTAGSNFQSVTTNGSFVQAEQFPNDDFGQIDSAAEITGGGGYETGYRFLSYFARANYTLLDRYLMTLSGRYDGSSRFGQDNRYGFFPAASLGWILTDEAFLSDSDLLSFLKLRTSYGVTGNAGIGNFEALGLWQAAGYGGLSGIFPDQTPNPALKWERTAQFDIGIDFGLFSDRINGELDFYIKNTSDLLLDVNVPSTTGFLTQQRNVGKLENRGFEFLVTSQNVMGTFNWSSTLNFGMNRNKITDLNGQVIEGGFINRAIEGEPIGVFYGLEYAGVDPDNGDGLYYVNETDENGNIVDPTATTNNPNVANRVIIGSPHPDFTGGLRNEFGYKGFELNVFFQFVYGNEIYDGGAVYKTSNGRFLDNQLATQLDAWQEPGDQTDVPEARLGLSNGSADSDRYLYDGSYLRLKNVTLAYNVPDVLLQTLNISRARVYVTGVNLLTFTNYPWWDPEVNSDYTAGNIGLGNEFYTAPQARTISGGIQFSF